MARSAVLNSWKSIVTYLQCGVRTAQRWEAVHDLPIRRTGGQRSSVIAFPSEIDGWLTKPRPVGQKNIARPSSNSLLIANARALRMQSALLRQEHHIAVQKLVGLCLAAERRWSERAR
jgi:hypothetical protein